MRHAWTHGRRGALLGASAAAVCLASILAGCGGSDGDGYVAAGSAAAGPRPAHDGAVAPTDHVRLVPLEGDGDGAEGDGRSPGSSGNGRGSGSAAGAGSGADTEAGGTGGTDGSGSGSAGSGGASGTSTEPAQSPSNHHTGDTGKSDESGGSEASSGGEDSPPAAAVLTTGNPERAAADDRWCEKVTLAFHNTGGSPVRSGEVTFGTHIIGALGIDWATIKSTEKLPTPIAAGEKKAKTWTVCVDSWRVPLGMHIETRDVSVKWG